MKAMKLKVGERPMYQSEDVFNESLKYFDGDELATNVFFKYALQDKDSNYYEKTPDEMHRRLSAEFARIEKKFGGPNQLSEEEIYGYFKDFRYICPQGSPMASIGNNYQNTSLSNCNVVKPPSDTMSSIFNTARDMANLYKRRYGVGTDLSNLRPSGAHVSNSAKTSSGAYSFADLYSYITRMIGQKNRRGALMLTMDIKHPDIENFITMKHDLKKVTGANISIKMRDDFMQAVKNDEEYTLQWPINSKKPKIARSIKAKELWQQIINSATKYAEPGIIYWDTIIKYLPAECYADVGFKHYSTNPCGELPLSEDSCRLISQNLKHLVGNPFTKDSFFDFNKWREVITVSQRLSDDLVELEIEKLNNLIKVADTKDEKQLFIRLKKACIEGRRTGLGTHGLADALARLGLDYDSDEALGVIDKIYNTLKVTSYKTSVELAKERGVFPVWDWEKEKNNAFIKSLPKKLRDEISKFGRRNISNLTNAPTGSVSILSQTSSGLEPVFKNKYMRRRKKNHDDEAYDTDFVDQMGDRWEEFSVFHHNAREWMELNPNKELPNYFVESDQIDWMRRVEIQAIMTKSIDHSISSTINLPKGTLPSVVGDLYMMAWESGCKGLTVYVDGSRGGVLIKQDQDKGKLKHIDAPKRPEALECDIHSASVRGEKWIILIGLMDEKPYEVFGGLSENVEIPPKYKSGIIIKASSNKTTANRYDLKLNGLKINNITRMFDNPLYQVHTRMVSLGLRHGVRPNFLVEQLLKDPDNDLTSFSKVLARVLKKYIEDGTKVTSDKICPSCKSESLLYQEGCKMCKNCGYSACS